MPRRICILSLLLASTLAGQVVFSRRVYQEQGRTYQQIWNWNPADGKLTQLTDSARDHFAPRCNGGRILFVSPEEWQESAKLWSFDVHSKTERIVGPVPPLPERTPDREGCDVGASSGPLHACGKRTDIVISHGGREIGRLHIKLEQPVLLLTWSPTRKYLLAGTIGHETNSTSPQSDYYVIDVDTMKLIPAGSGNSGGWVPGKDEIFFTTPRDLAPLLGSRRSRGVWIQHLTVFDPVSGRTTPVTSGLSNNLQPRSCRP